MPEVLETGTAIIGGTAATATAAETMTGAEGGTSVVAAASECVRTHWFNVVYKLML